MNEKDLLASLAVFRELYDKGNDLYAIIANFIEDVICQKGLHAFSLSQLTHLFNEQYEFNLPSAVLKTSLKRLEFIEKKDGQYRVTNTSVLSSYLTDEKNKIKSSHEEIFNRLTTYTQTKIGEKLTAKDVLVLQKNFCNYLLDENNGEEYLEYISSFIIDHQNSSDFNKKIKLIREGVILYSGIRYTNDSYNFNQFGSWRNELRIFLDTEIIFHILGFNGELYKEIAQDFLNFVSEINRKNKTKIIHLAAFSGYIRYILFFALIGPIFYFILLRLKKKAIPLSFNEEGIIIDKKKWFS